MSTRLDQKIKQLENTAGYRAFPLRPVRGGQPAPGRVSAEHEMRQPQSVFSLKLLGDFSMKKFILAVTVAAFCSFSFAQTSSALYT
jgi:hypothetical protein